MTIRIDEEQKTIFLSVRDLTGDDPLALFEPGGPGIRTRSALGQVVHIKYQEKRAAENPDYRKEVYLSHKLEIDGYRAAISGRIDGWLDLGGEILLEEVKSVFLTPDELYAATPETFPTFVDQLLIYCYFVAAESGRPVRGRLVLVNITTREERIFDLPSRTEDTRLLVENRLRVIIHRWRESLEALRKRREAAPALRFPFESVRPQQDRLMLDVSRALEEGRNALVSAPAGVGKTAGTLYPALAFALRADKRVFFVTSKTTQQRIASETLDRMAEKCPAFTAVVLRAKEKICPNETCFCHEDFCPYLRDFPAKVEGSQILERLLGRKVVTPDAIASESLKIEACPFQISLLLAARADVVICDYNYVFDPRIALDEFSGEEPYDNLILIIDEAHNLPERARGYYSPVLRADALVRLKNGLPITSSELFHEIENEVDSILEFLRGMGVQGSEEQPDEEKFIVEDHRAFFRKRKKALDALAIEYYIYRKLRGDTGREDPLLDFFSEFSYFCQAANLKGEQFRHVYEQTDWGGNFAVLCLDASRFIGERIKGFHSTVAMSATLKPFDYYIHLLGLREDQTETIEIGSPFPPKNRKIVVIPSINTTYRARGRYHGRIAEIIERIGALRSGNYLVLFPSYRYMQDVLARVSRSRFDILVQSESMSEHERSDFLAELKRPRRHPLLAFGVQGGIFSEGVDYPGEMLIGIVVVSPALPQVSFERELLLRYYEELLGKGFEYAYLIPGMQRVIQSAGRVIRSEIDVGVVALLCRRFATQEYAKLFPRDWYRDSPRELVPENYEEEIREFWERS